MTTTITPVSQALTALPLRSVAGERVMMDGGTAPLRSIIQNLYDRTQHAIDATVADIGWSGDFSVDPGGSASTFAVNVGAIGSIVLATSTGYVVRAATAATIGASKIAGGGNLGADSWYRVYAYESSGSVDYEISTTAPSSARRTKTGDATRRYLGCFRTTSAGAPIPVRASRGRYVYRASALGATGLAVVTSGTDSSYTAFSCAGFVPPHARLATLRVRAVGTGSAAVTDFAEVQTNGDSGAFAFALESPSRSAGSALSQFDIELDSSQRGQYRVQGSTPPTVDIYVLGFYE
jgi:hypothetical protein